MTVEMPHAQREWTARSYRPGDILILAMWFGLVCGLVEGAGLLTFQKLGWLNWNMRQMGVWVEIIWVSAAFGFVLFSAMGLLLTLIGRYFRPIPPVQSAWFLFVLLTCLDWLLLSGRIRMSGCVILAFGLAVIFHRWFRGHGEFALNFARKSLPYVGCLAIVALVGIEGGLRVQEWRMESRLPSPAPNSPNILVIVIDTLRADHLSAYGYQRQTSPHLDQFAREGVLFENAFSTSSWTLPSHASLLTGQYPSQHGAERNPLGMKPPTIPEQLQALGYRTAAFSANYIYFCQREGFGRGFMRFEDYFTTVADMAFRTVYGRKFEHIVWSQFASEDLPARILASQISDASLRWIVRDDRRPFFVFLNYFDTHDPYLPPEPFRSKFSASRNPGGMINGYRGRLQPELSPEQLQSEIAAYDGAIAYVDDQIRKLLAGLDARGILKNTLVVITSDHGEEFGEHGLYNHGDTLYGSSIRVPLIFRWPSRVPAGVRIERPVSNAALPATLMDLLGRKSSSPFPQPSLTDLWTSPEKASAWPHPLAELAKHSFQAENKRLAQLPVYRGWTKALVTERWHFLAYEKQWPELFDRQSDPYESRNLADTPQGKELVKDMLRQLADLVPQGRSARASALAERARTNR